MAVINVSDSEFEKKVLKSDSIVLCDFWARWVYFSTISFWKLSGDFKENKIVIAKVNIDENPKHLQNMGL